MLALLYVLTLPLELRSFDLPLDGLGFRDVVSVVPARQLNTLFMDLGVPSGHVGCLCIGSFKTKQFSTESYRIRSNTCTKGLHNRAHLFQA